MGRTRSVVTGLGGGLAVAMALLLGDGPAGSETPPEPGVPTVLPDVAEHSTLLPCARAGERIVLTASAHLDPGCIWTAGFDIVASDVVLDCRGATIASTGGGRGIEISSPTHTAMSDVTVRHCRVEGFLNNLRVTRPGFRDLAEGVEYDNGLTDVVIEHNDFRASHGVGVFIDGYVSDATIRHNTIEGAGSTGIYLETGSRRTRVENNRIHDNGFRENGPGGDTFEIYGFRFRWWGIGREGLAIDGSYDNTVVGNSFAGNSHGGILLYTNCGEYPDSGRWFDRRWPADDNHIEANTFTGGLNGIWVGQRMAENTLPMECTKPAYVDNLIQRVTRDHAADNTLLGNHFTDVVYPIRVEDDGTTVADNVITSTDPDHHGIIVGTEFRTTVLGEPVADTELTGNRIAVAGNHHPIRWVHGYDGLTVLGNTAHGEPVGICEGEQPPRLSFIWVIAAVPEPEGSPVTPPPDDLAHPVLDALDPCPDLPMPRIVPGQVETAEGDVVRIPVTLDGPADRTVVATWTTATLDREGWAEIGTDVEAVEHGEIRFDPGSTDAVLEIPTIDDDRPEGDEWIVGWLISVDGARPGGFYGLGFGRIIDNDGP